MAVKCKAAGDSTSRIRVLWVVDMKMAVLVMMVLEVKMAVVAVARKTVTE